MYSAPTPSLLAVFTMQSIVPEYGIRPSASGFIVISRDLARSMGLEVSAATTPAMNDAPVCTASPSFAPLSFRMTALLLSYTAICDAVTIIARFTVGAHPRHSAKTPSSRTTRASASPPCL